MIAIIAAVVVAFAVATATALRSKYKNSNPPIKNLVFFAPPSRLNYHIELKNPDDVAKYEEAFEKEIKDRGEEFKYFKV